MIPTLKPSKRDREYRLRSFEEISQIIFTWMFKDDVGHREMDKDILGLDPDYSRGYQSMGVLHHLGLRKEFKGIFVNVELRQALEKLSSDKQDFNFIIELLESTSPNYDEVLIQSLLEAGSAQTKDFEEHYKLRLEEMKQTDGHTNQIHSRKEQGILRSILFKGELSSKCAICHRTFPTKMMVAAHIKPRSKCNTSERKNPKIVMPLCKVGCDEIFERGYIIIGKTGRAEINKKMPLTRDLTAILDDLVGNPCTHFNQETKSFFSYKRDSLLEK